MSPPPADHVSGAAGSPSGNHDSYGPVPSTNGTHGHGGDTRTRLLDTAEALFARDGYDGTSLRAITRAADVGLALVNYHFGNKKRLLREIIARRMVPINNARIARLDELEARYGADGPLPLEEVLKAFIEPFLDAEDVPRQRFLRLVQSQVKNADEFLREMWAEHFALLTRRFRHALHRALPGLPEDEVIWRLHIFVGMVMAALTQPMRLRLLSEGRLDPLDRERLLAELIHYGAAGFNAPARSQDGNEA